MFASLLLNGCLRRARLGGRARHRGDYGRVRGRLRRDSFDHGPGVEANNAEAVREFTTATIAATMSGSQPPPYRAGRSASARRIRGSRGGLCKAMIGLLGYRLNSART